MDSSAWKESSSRTQVSAVTRRRRRRVLCWQQFKSQGMSSSHMPCPPMAPPGTLGCAPSIAAHCYGNPNRVTLRARGRRLVINKTNCKAFDGYRRNALALLGGHLPKRPQGEKKYMLGFSNSFHTLFFNLKT